MLALADYNSEHLQEPQMTLIQATNITKSYRVGDMQVPALKGISFSIDEGAFAAFVGPSGSGKSTLLNLIGCLDHPDSGTLLVNGTDIGTLSRQQAAAFRGEHLGFIFQDFNLVPVLSVYENIEYPLLMVRGWSPEKRREHRCRGLRSCRRILRNRRSHPRARPGPGAVNAHPRCRR